MYITLEGSGCSHSIYGDKQEYQPSYLGDKYHHMQSKPLNYITVVSQARA